MYRDVSLLDCTLRDGGYVNDWNFGHSVITSTYKRLSSSRVDYIEVGFIDDRRKFDINRSIVPNTRCFNTIFKDVNKGDAIPVAMIDFGTCSIENISDVSETFIDGIRVIFKKEKIQDALPFCKEIKNKGYKLFIQAISITSYSDMEMLEYIEKINEIEPYAFSIVDTYGLLDEKKLTNYFRLMDNNLKSHIKLGYHGHNNFQLAFSNSIKFLSLDTKRSLIVDATVYGMGKSAGNCAIELMAMHMNSQYEKNYDVNQYLEILDSELMSIYMKKNWGYRYNFFISALQNCHPNYVSFLLEKKTLSVTDINTILGDIPIEDRLLYDEDLIEIKYKQFQSKQLHDSSKDLFELKKKIKHRSILLLGPGKSIITELPAVKHYIQSENPIIITVNFISDLYNSDYIFISNAKRFNKLMDENKIKIEKLIVTSNVAIFDNISAFRLNYQELLGEGNNKSDSALLLILSALRKMEAAKVCLAGFDGFLGSSEDYYKISYSFGDNEDFNLRLNTKISEGIKFWRQQGLNINFITKSLYEK